MEETSRLATDADLARVVELASAAVAELTPTRGGAIWARREARPAPLETNLAEVIGSPRHLVVVGELDGTVVGYAIAELESLRDGGVLARLDDLYVDAGARGVGVGETMMNHVLEWAVDHGCIGIDSVALPGNRATKNFFESFGLVARAIVVHRPLTESPGPSTEPGDPEEAGP